MKFEWDAEKARQNITKHPVSFERARGVLNDPFHISIALHRGIRDVRMSYDLFRQDGPLPK